MGSFLDKPKTEKKSEAGDGNGLRYGLSCMQGWRVEMEDAHTALTSLNASNLQDWSFFGVFDGHAGAEVSKHSSQFLLDSIMKEGKFQPAVQKIKETESSSKVEDVELVKEAIRLGFLSFDESMRKLPELASGEDKSGTTAVCSLISPNYIYVANCGDSRALLYRKDTLAVCTEDHKPFNPVEKERIQNAGGSVMISRVNGSLAVSRALGDYEYKNVEGKGQCEQLVSPEPELYVQERSEEDQFLVLACDGVWDVMTNEELCTFVRSRFLITHDLEVITNQVLDTCFNKNSRDNMSIVVVAFPNAPPVCPAAVAREKALDALLERKVTALCTRDPPASLNQVLESLLEDNLPDLPPGGGFAAKKALVEQTFRRLRPDCVEDEPKGVEQEILYNLQIPM